MPSQILFCVVQIKIMLILPDLKVIDSLLVDEEKFGKMELLKKSMGVRIKLLYVYEKGRGIMASGHAQSPSETTLNVC